MNNNVCSEIFWYGDMLLQMKFSKILYTKYKEESEAMTSSTHSLFISTDQEMFRWKLQKFKISYLPYFLNQIYIKFSLFLFQIFLIF